MKCDFKLILTGTPLTNTMLDLYTLLNFLNPDKINDFKKFEKFNGTDEDDDENFDDMNALIEEITTPYILRRNKEQKKTDLRIPAKKEVIVEIELTKQQKTLYRAVFEKKRSFFVQRFNKTIGGQVFTSLKNICNHPYTLDRNVEEQLIAEMRKETPDITDEDAMIQCSSKLVVVDKLLAKFKGQNEKVLIFSQRLDILNILEDYLEYREYEYVRLDGSTNHETRTENIDQFNRDPKCFVFLLSTKAGGIGINLTAANNVIIYDSDFNPFNDSQAAARCHRIGQTKNVYIYRLITRNTYEMYILERAGIKLTLGSLVIDKDVKFKNSADELKMLLQRGAYHFFLEDEKSANEKDKELLDTNIDDLIGKSRVLQYSSSQYEESPNGKIESVYIDTDATKIDWNDENFWEKVIPEGLDDPETLFDVLKKADTELVTPEQKEQFLQKLKKCCDELGFHMTGNTSLSSDYQQSLWKLIYKVVNMTEQIFSPEQMNLAQQLLKQVESKNDRKKGRVKYRKSQSFIANSDGSDEEFVPEASPTELDQDEFPETTTTATPNGKTNFLKLSELQKTQPQKTQPNVKQFNVNQPIEKKIAVPTRLKLKKFPITKPLPNPEADIYQMYDRFYKLDNQIKQSKDILPSHPFKYSGPGFAFPQPIQPTRLPPVPTYDPNQPSLLQMFQQGPDISQNNQATLGQTPDINPYFPAPEVNQNQQGGEKILTEIEKKQLEIIERIKLKKAQKLKK